MGNAMTTLLVPASVAERMQLLLSKKLLKVQEDELVMDQFAMLDDLPRNAGANQIRFFKPEKAASGLYSAPTDANTAALKELTEGTAPTTFRENVWTKVDVTLKQYGQVTKLTDILSAVDAYEPLKQNIALMGRDCALSFDTCTRNALVGSAHPGTGGNSLTHSSSAGSATYGCEIFATAVLGAFTPTSLAGVSATLFTALSGAAASVSKLTRAGVLSAATRLAVKKAPKLKNGNYVCILPPQQRHDLVQDSDYKVAFQGKGAEGVYKNVLGTIDGVTFVNSTNPYIEDESYGIYDSTDDNGDGLIYTALFLGAGAYGVPKLAGSKSPKRPQVIINDQADKFDPLNQTVIAGWKAFYMAAGLDTDNIVALRAKSTWA